MASSQKMLILCLCLLLSSFGVLVDAGHGLMSLFGGGKHGDHGTMEMLLIAGLLASILKNKQNHQNHGHGGHAAARVPLAQPQPYIQQGYAQQAYVPQAYAQQAYAPYHYGLAYQHGYGY